MPSSVHSCIEHLFSRPIVRSLLPGSRALLYDAETELFREEVNSILSRRLIAEKNNLGHLSKQLTRAACERDTLSTGLCVFFSTWAEHRAVGYGRPMALGEQ